MTKEKAIPTTLKFGPQKYAIEIKIRVGGIFFHSVTSIGKHVPTVSHPP